MVVIGGTNLAGGRGGIGLTLLGILTIDTWEKLSINAVPEAGRLMATGVIIILAVSRKEDAANKFSRLNSSEELRGLWGIIVKINCTKEECKGGENSRETRVFEKFSGKT